MASSADRASALEASVTVREDHLTTFDDFELPESEVVYHRLDADDGLGEDMDDVPEATEPDGAAAKETEEAKGEQTDAARNHVRDPKSPAIAKTPQEVACLGLACARLCCTWSCKLMLLLLFFEVCYLWGALGLGRTLWLPISLDKACQQCADQRGCPKVLAQTANVRGGLRRCEELCEATPGCEAVDWFDSTSWCNLYSEACELPTANWDQGASYQMAVGCDLQNGSTGILMGGRCVLGVELPKGVFGLMLEEVPLLLSSPCSWGCTLAVVGIYTYVTSPWLHARMAPMVMRTSKVLGPARKLWPMLAVPAAGLIATKASTSTRLGCLLLLVLLLPLLLFRSSRRRMLSVLTYVMKPFVALVACALSACFDTASVDLSEAATAWGRAVAVDGVLTTDGAVVAEGAAAADAEAGAGSAAIMSDGVTAANAAVAAQAAAVKEAAVAADTINTVASACAVQ